MKREKALAIVEKQLKKKRYEHTVRVMETAIKLAEHYSGNIQKAEQAAIFHDYAKYRSPEEMRRWVIEEGLPHDLLEYGDELLHGPVGSVMIEREVGIKDPEVQSAIYYHTTGKQQMSLLEKIIFIADYVEPGRIFPGVEEVRVMAFQDIDNACWMAARNTIRFLMEHEQPVYPDTFHLYNEKLMNKK
ncbi:putative HD superfamily hydrolase of NAD metabolism [Gracilibacillus ureilyticus]|uniref:bis(5'-nucleosyl)-tetraphosphatase (symmetrical) n=1 Tax=Gracilibacillus ureilyticus TaxID=531814 RepID=A0A1H9RJ27_9BACI|nr:bis(5'-nucleosyl)-tetraphosphatase (symmetrical) YqeK [Gracilibacillus ureilyticus]SER72841.1 putative HD superfamily hydrolase of NAD metabolism [Gracilibacillus ureilyticus]